jgi:hypothetical protein
LTAHSPGPWHVVGWTEEDKRLHAATEGGEPPFFFITRSGGPPSEDMADHIANVFEEADARLIAAAPELLDALKRLSDLAADPDDYRDISAINACLNDAEALIRRVEGT